MWTMFERALRRALTWIESKVRLPRVFKTLLLLLIPTCVCVLGAKARINILGNALRFEVPAFKKCELVFSRPVNIQSYNVSNASGTGGFGVHNLGEQLRLTIENTNHVKSDSLVEPTIVAVAIGPSVSTEIVHVFLDGAELKLKSFFLNNLKTPAEFLTLRYIRTYLADLILKGNEICSNWILTFMFFFLLLELTRLGEMEYRLYCPPARFEKHLVQRLDIKDMGNRKARMTALDKYRCEWWELANRMRFLQALGPALGFIMTVSSLVQALHPTNLTSRNLDGFLSGIHVAMIATFLGLLLRLIALEAARANDQLLKRAEIRLELDIKDKLP